MEEADLSRLGRFARWARMGNNKEATDALEDGETMAETGTAEEMESTAAEPTQEPSAEPTPASEAVSAEELEQLRSERDGFRDRLLRLQAEFDNARKRESKERQDARDYATQNSIEPFLGVMDNFGLALKAEGSADQLKLGVEMILRQMEEALRGLGVQAVESVGSQFDPRIHEALGSIESKEFPDHQVLEEIRKGYRLRDKLLRPALVRIASNPDQVSE